MRDDSDWFNVLHVREWAIILSMAAALLLHVAWHWITMPHDDE